MTNHYQKAYFLLSAAEITQLPPDTGIELAIVGRSNAGKSSVLNRIASHKIARVSKTPGRTQLLNTFILDDERRLIDLPGYGFAKVPIAVKQKWQKLIDTYIRNRESLKGLVVIMDVRHPMRDLDILLLEYCEQCGLKVHIVLNKQDKISKSAALSTLREVKKAVEVYSNKVSVQLFSALKNTGLKELHTLLDEWYAY
jgi:GTP-binding protein